MATARKTTAKKPTTSKRSAPAAARTKKGGPLRSKKPGKNQVARARKTALAPAAAPGPAPAAPPDTSRPRAMAIARAGLAKKAEAVLVLDVRGLTSYADYFVLLTADSERQAGAIADAVEEAMKADGAEKVGVEGYESGRWILVDYGDVVAHVFSREARGFYDLESLWADAKRLEVKD